VGKQQIPILVTTKNGSHDIAEILLKVALNTISINKKNQCPMHLYRTNHTNTIVTVDRAQYKLEM
jgi:hypothetical protein